MPKSSSGSSPGETGPTLIDMLTDLRTAIEGSQQSLRVDSKDALFRFETVEVEVNFVVEKTKKGEAGVRWLFVTVGGQANYSTEQVHKLKMVLKPTSKALQEQRDFVAGPESGPPPRRDHPL